MISYQVYKVIHLTGVFMVIFALGAVIMHSLSSGERHYPFRKPVAITHGLGMLISLVGGFGLLARLGFTHGPLPPNWALAKIGIWLIFGGLIGLLIRRPQTSKMAWIAVIVLSCCASYLANYKPF